MRLKKLKLSGFKSFVEPTTVLFPSSLVAIVGPNGCGKSNIIDAVRWVMGESSAKHLRGESMTDVIFNGSRDRKPVGQASIELVFENDAGRLLGEYASYREIAIRRVVTRDGQSNYYLNNTKCRRKDVTDIFLGTGLGPRSYSIIGQGTISRIIEARPEELRVFLEEAAGISKYKERRRETENRIRHTRENLERVTDVREELGKQLERLKRQAQAAEKYKELKGQERLYKAQWHALRWQGLTDQIEQLDKALAQKNCELEALLSEQTQLERETEQKRQGFEQSNDVLNQAQGEFYRLGAEIARLEESIQHQRERKRRLEDDLNQAKAQWQLTQQHVLQHQEKESLLTQLVAQLGPEIDELKTELATQRALLEESEREKEHWQAQWDSFIQVAAESSKIAHVEQSKIQQIETAISGIQKRLDALMSEQNQLDVLPFQEAISRLQLEQNELEELHGALKVKMELALTALKNTRTELAIEEEKYHAARTSLEQLKAQEASLQQLQQSALGQEHSETQAWQEQQCIDQAKRLAQLVQVEAGYETVLEMALGDRLQALCVEDWSALATASATLERGTLTLLDKRCELTAAVLTDKPALYQKVSCEYAACQNLLSGLYVADTVTTALAWLPDIGKHESILTQDGCWLGHGWMRVMREHDLNSGVLAREKAIKEIHARIEVEETALETQRATIERLKHTIETVELEKETLQQQVNDAFSKISDKHSQLQVKHNRVEQMQSRLVAIEEQLATEIMQREEHEQQLLEARHQWQQAMKTMEMDAERRETLTEAQRTIADAVDAHRRQLGETRQLLYEKELQYKTKQSELVATKEAVEREQSHLDVLNERIESLVIAHETALADDNDSPEQQLEYKLNQHLQAEERLKKAKLALDALKAELSTIEKQKSAVAEKLRNQQGQIDAIRMEKQTVWVRRQTVEEALAEGEYAIKTLLEGMPEHASEKAWDEELKTIAIRIQRLGAINLAAIDEYQIESERKNHLDKQYDDLMEALETLENAIRKIDKETRARFKDTYDQVNEGFQRLFPRVFGGGQAYLELTGDDLLDTGVAVMARPPGKRNSTIHLLSGGEKALTAVALVFAIFQLNPSPFCMLDEVDAPLDDANVGRFCDLVKSMAEHVQFIFISHNKVAMEMANHLLGVTMSEPGVSRLVSVDVQEAMAIAD